MRQILSYRRHPCGGYTWLETSIAMAVVVILVTIAAPRLASSIRKANEAASVNMLGTIRSGLAIYYTGSGGVYPSDITPLSQPGNEYLNGKIKVYTTAHGVQTNIDHQSSLDASLDTGSIGYVNAGPQLGTVWIECTDTD